MRIERIEATHYQVPLPTVLTDSTHGEMRHFELVTVRLYDSDGAEGVGYTYSVNHGGAAIRTLIAEDLVPQLLGEETDRIARLWQRMWWAVHYCGRGGLAAFAISAVDIALWDLAARRRGQPLWRLLGGHDPQVRAYAGGIDLLLPLDDLLAQSDENRSRGFRAIKMKVGRDVLREDVERVGAMRAHLGEDFTLMADANMRWRRDQAVRAARALEPFALTWLEEPLIPDDVEGHAALAAQTATPIATGENFHTLYEFERFIRAGAVQFPEPDVSNCGGISVWMKVAALAEAANLPVTSHGVHDLHVHLLAAVPNASFLEVHGFGLERFIAEPLEIREGFAAAPERPGHGVEFDWEALAAHRRG